jgi:hypothetical protein
MCRVLADLLDPRGKHCQGSRYLRLFWETVGPKLPDGLALDVERATEAVVPVRENLKQLIAAVKSLCGKSEDAEMENEIFKLVTKDDDTVRAALAISGATDFGNKAWEAFKGPVTALVQKAFPHAEYIEEDGWYYLGVPVRNGNFWLEVNYLWDKVCLQIPDDAETLTEAEIAALYEVMSRCFNQRPARKNERLPWSGEGIAWPSFAQDDLYQFHLYKLYAEKPQEVAEKIIAIAHALESVKV